MKKVKIIYMNKLINLNNWEKEEQQLEEFISNHTIIDIHQSNYGTKGIVYIIIYHDNSETITTYEETLKSQAQDVKELYKRESAVLATESALTTENMKKR